MRYLSLAFLLLWSVPAFAFTTKCPVYTYQKTGVRKQGSEHPFENRTLTPVLRLAIHLSLTCRTQLLMRQSR
jgi:hypothetical protein